MNHHLRRFMAYYEVVLPVPSYPMRASPPRIEIAYLGRFYHKPGLGKTSKYFVYATDLHGKRKLTISPGPVKAGTQVRWADKDTVAWQVGEGWQLFNVLTGRRGTAKRVDSGPRRTWDIGGGALLYKDQPPILLSYDRDLATSVTLSKDGKKVTVRAERGSFTQIAPTMDPSRTLVVFRDGTANGMGDEDEIMRVDWKLGKAFPWRRQIKETQLFPDRDLFLARHENRELIPYGKNGNVWGDRIYAGRMTTNEMWTVVGGTVWCGTPALRPL